MLVTVFNTTKGKTVCKAEVANSFLRRAFGLMLKSPKNKLGLLIEYSPLISSRTIHSYFMRFPIVLIFIDEGKRVTEIRNLDPWGVCSPKKPCRWVLEVPKDMLLSGIVELGDVLEFYPA